jgi:hypothetical protein
MPPDLRLHCLVSDVVLDQEFDGIVQRVEDLLRVGTPHLLIIEIDK